MALAGGELAGVPRGVLCGQGLNLDAGPDRAMRGVAKSAALREIVGDLLGTRGGATCAVKNISGVTQRIDQPGDHPLVSRFVPDLWLADGSRLADHGVDQQSPVGVLVRPDGVVVWVTDGNGDAGLEAAIHRWAGAYVLVRVGLARSGSGE